MFQNTIRTIIEGLDKSFKREYEKFDQYNDVAGLNEYKDLVISLRKSDILIKFDKLAHYVVDDSNFEETYKPSKTSNDFFVMSNKKLSNSFLPSFFPSIKGLITAIDVEALLMLIQFNYFYYSNMRCSRMKTIEKVFCGDILQYLSFFTDDYKSMQELPDYDDSFFKNMKKVAFEDDRARLLEDFLRCGYLSLIIVEQKISLTFFNNIKCSAMYLIVCNALKRNSLKINCEDVVVGYTLTLRLITDDVRSYVREAFYKNK